MPSPPTETPQGSSASQSIERLDRRHKELLTRIDELNEEVLAALASATQGATQADDQQAA